MYYVYMYNIICVYHTYIMSFVILGICSAKTDFLRRFDLQHARHHFVIFNDEFIQILIFRILKYTRYFVLLFKECHVTDIKCFFSKDNQLFL